MRLFVAVWPSEQALDQLASLPRPETAAVRWTTRAQWHVTLRFLGHLDEPGEAVEALEAVAPLPPAGAVMGPATIALSRSILCVPVDGLEELAEVTRAVTARLGRAPDPRPFRGHVTLARARRGSVSGLAGVAVSATFAVDHVSVVSSTLHAAGARYDLIARVPVRP